MKNVFPILILLGFVITACDKNSYDLNLNGLNTPDSVYHFNSYKIYGKAQMFFLGNYYPMINAKVTLSIKNESNLVSSTDAFGDYSFSFSPSDFYTFNSIEIEEKGGYGLSSKSYDINQKINADTKIDFLYLNQSKGIYLEYKLTYDTLFLYWKTENISPFGYKVEYDSKWYTTPPYTYSGRWETIDFFNQSGECKVYIDRHCCSHSTRKFRVSALSNTNGDTFISSNVVGGFEFGSN